MSEFTSTGVVTKSLDEWYDAVVAFKRAVWGNDYVTDPTTKQGADITQLAELLYNAEMNNVSAFAQLNLNTATGVCLDYIGLVRGIQRDGGYPQQIRINMTSSVIGWTLTPDVVFRTTSGYNYYSPSSVAITELEQTVVLVYISDGNPDVSAGDPLMTIQANTNIVSAVIADGGIIQGAETENDASYRKRLKDADIGFIGTLELMASELRKIQGLAKLNYFYNDTGTTDAKGIPAYSTEFIVVPQDGIDDTVFNAAVAQKILDTKVPGSPTYGNTSLLVYDYFGEAKTVYFSRATKVGVQFYAKIRPNDQTGIIDISNVPTYKQAIVDYINNLDIGNPARWSRILGIISPDQGFTIEDWGLRKVGSAWGKADLTTSIRQYLWIELANIDISTTAPEGIA